MSGKYDIPKDLLDSPYVKELELAVTMALEGTYVRMHVSSTHYPFVWNSQWQFQ